MDTRISLVHSGFTIGIQVKKKKKKQLSREGENKGDLKLSGLFGTKLSRNSYLKICYH